MGAHVQLQCESTYTPRISIPPTVLRSNLPPCPSQSSRRRTWWSLVRLVHSVCCLCDLLHPKCGPARSSEEHTFAFSWCHDLLVITSIEPFRARHVLAFMSSGSFLRESLTISASISQNMPKSIPLITTPHPLLPLSLKLIRRMIRSCMGRLHTKRCKPPSLHSPS